MIKPLLAVLLLVSAADTVAPREVSSIEQENCAVLRAAMQYNIRSDYLCATRPFPVGIFDWQEPFPVGDCKDPSFRIRTKEETGFTGCMMTFHAVHRADYYAVTVGRADITEKNMEVAGNVYAFIVLHEDGKWVTAPLRSKARPNPAAPPTR